MAYKPTACVALRWATAGLPRSGISAFGYPGPPEFAPPPAFNCRLKKAMQPRVTAPVTARRSGVTGKNPYATEKHKCFQFFLMETIGGHRGHRGAGQ